MNKTTDILRIALAQLNPTVGDIAGNLEIAKKALAEAGRGQADLVLFTELFIAGYPPEDLVLKSGFVKQCMEAVEELAAETKDGGPAVLIGSPLRNKDGLFNAMALLDEGEIKTRHFINALRDLLAASLLAIVKSKSICLYLKYD